MRITRDMSVGKLRLSRVKYVKKSFLEIQYKKGEAVRTPLASHFRLSKDQSQKIKAKQEHMMRTPYT